MSFKYSSLLPKEGGFASKYHPGPTIELVEKRIKEVLIERNPIDCEQWRDIKDELMTDMELLTESNFSTIIMNAILKLNKLHLAQTFLEYLNSVKLKPNLLTYLKFISICSKNVETCKQELILDTFKKVRPLIDTLPVLDHIRATYIIQGLCATDKWRDSFDYLKKLPFRPNNEIRSILACAAIRNDDEVLAWEIITKWMKKGEHPSSQVINEFLLRALRLQKRNSWDSDRFILKLFQYIRVNEYIITERTAKFVEEYFKRHSSQWKITYSKVERTGMCGGCKKSLKLEDLTNGEYLCLQKEFLERAVKKTDLFINTTDAEFQRYIKFIEVHKPFHIVLDGLNAAYTYPGKGSRKNLAVQLLKIISLLSGDSRRLLVFGRHHMKYWPKPVMQKIAEKSKVFFTDNISQDDPFLLYAALASGPYTRFVSLDLMRDHMARLDDPKLIAMFQKWQQSHQIFLTVDKDNNIKFTDPLHYSICLQGDMTKGWHIPFDDKIILDPYEELNNWLCIERILR